MFKVNQKVYMLEVPKIFNYEPTYLDKLIGQKYNYLGQNFNNY